MTGQTYIEHLLWARCCMRFLQDPTGSAIPLYFLSDLIYYTPTVNCILCSSYTGLPISQTCQVCSQLRIIT